VPTLFNHDDRLTELDAEPLWRRIVHRVVHGPEYPSRRIARKVTFFTLLGLSAVFGAMCGLMVVYSIDLPQIDDLMRYRPNTTTELLDVHGRPFGSFALERRVTVPYSQFSPLLKQAIVSIEDKSFESNWGVNLFRAVGAAYRDLHSKGKTQGASTLTMQLARNLFLSSEKTYSRKIQEIILSMQIERRFTKDQIFELYANQIYLGRGTYGFEAGSEYYFSKHAKDLNLPEAALLAALPKGPEYYSPVRFPDRALKRRNLVLSEMLEDKKITQAQAEAAMAAPLGLHLEAPPNSIAPYFVEEVRRQLEKEYGVEEVHGAGLKVYTTLDLDLQMVANRAVLDGVATYERRHGWKGELENVVLEGQDITTYRHPDWSLPITKGSYVHGVVLDVQPKEVTVNLGSREAVLTPDDWKWTQNLDGDSFLKNGDLVYIRITGEDKDGTFAAALEQDSGAQGSLMAVNNADGEVLAMIGGRDFALSQFNRATQAERQVGSSFKPYVYTTAIEAGAKPTDIIVDGPTTFPSASGPYTPHNYEGDYRGAMTLINAFAESRNIPALKLAFRYGIRKVIETAHRFGVTSDIPPALPIAIGAADISLYEQVGAYSVFPNDGIRIEPHYIRKIVQADGLPMDLQPPQVDEVISVDTARTMMQFLEAVVQHGTAASAGWQLKHPLGGKTGTTNDFTDAWFIGFSPSVTCGTWIGYDDRRSLGEKETGARAALPTWIDFMRVVIADKPDETFPAEGAPKKVLDVAVSKPGVVDSVPKAAPKESDDEEDADSNSKPAPAAQNIQPKSVTAPVQPKTLTAPTLVKPATAPTATTPKPAGTPSAPKPVNKPVGPATEPATPNGEQYQGVSHPPDDTN
jgi:penicillin-binding protein 1A